MRRAHFLAQCCHECAGFQTTEEFADRSDCEGRKDLGNVKRGDGPRYKGRGILQLTGRANYREYGKVLKIELEANPLLAADPAVSLLIACEYWKKRKINPDADRDDVVTVARKINGGERGLPERRQLTAKAKAVLARLEGIQLSGAQSDQRPVLTQGFAGEEVGKLQVALRKLGHPIAVDDDFGAATELAVMSFQQNQGLLADGSRQGDLGRAQGRREIAGPRRGRISCI
ncbi:MAG: peptidoglycan-binding protein [Methyloceanibacter sp.]|uniref:peptidoglycan-binding protein n=1 Tax=Methyloceanibacter sp. TaxID=1965321 RepID=UPI003D9BB6F9